MGLSIITGEYQVYGVPGRLRPLGPPTGAPGPCGGVLPLDPLFLGCETWLRGGPATRHPAHVVVCFNERSARWG